MWERQAAPILFQLRLNEGDPFNQREANSEERKILDSEPELDDQCLLVLEAWQELDSCRPPSTFGTGKIPLSPCIYEWARFNGLDRELTQMVASSIRYLDGQRMERLISEYEHRNGG